MGRSINKVSFHVGTNMSQEQLFRFIDTALFGAKIQQAKDYELNYSHVNVVKVGECNDEEMEKIRRSNMLDRDYT